MVSLVVVGCLTSSIVCAKEDPEIHYSPVPCVHDVLCHLYKLSLLIATKGYPAENHWVTTQDGYILNLQRIPHGKAQNSMKIYFMM